MFRWWVAIVAAGNLLPSAPWRIYFFPSSFAPEMGKGKLFPRPLNCIRSHWWLFSSQTPPSASRDLFQSVEKEKKKPSLTWRGRKEMALCSLLSEEHLRKEEKKRHNRWKCIERGPCGWGQRDGKDRLFRSADRVRLNGGAFSLYNHTLGRAAAGQEYSSRCVWLAADFFCCCRPKSVKNFFFIFFLWQFPASLLFRIRNFGTFIKSSIGDRCVTKHPQSRRAAGDLFIAAPQTETDWLPSLLFCQILSSNSPGWLN